MLVASHDDDISSKIQLIGKSIENLDLAFNSEATKRLYHEKLRQFFNHIGISPDDFIAKVKENPKFGEVLILRYVGERKKEVDAKKVSASTLSSTRSAIKLFLGMNDVEGINWEKISKVLPPRKKVGSDRSPTKEEIRQIITNWENRLNVVVLMQASGGLRVGAFNWLNFGDIEPIFEHNGKYEIIPFTEYESCLNQGWKFLCAKVTIYRNEPEEYYTFITPEAFHALWQYKKERERYGEIITSSSPLIRDKWDSFQWLRSSSITEPKRLKSKSISNKILRRLWFLGLRTEHKRVHEFKQDHGFRKFFETNAKRVLKPEDVERLKGRLSNYYKPEFEYLLKEYLKAIPYLTISETAQLKDEIEKRVVDSDRRIGELEREREYKDDSRNPIEIEVLDS
ncbi:MAG: hypothetical protein QXP55_01795 [Nitrososphaerales archaeon]